MSNDEKKIGMLNILKGVAYFLLLTYVTVYFYQEYQLKESMIGYFEKSKSERNWNKFFEDAYP